MPHTMRLRNGLAGHVATETPPANAEPRGPPDR